mgnify:CR=1 FL=1
MHNSPLSPATARLRGEKGQGLAEYIIIGILVAIIVLVAVKFFGKSVYNQFENATNQVESLQKDAP